jgi:hypothetical protein
MSLCSARAVGPVGGLQPSVSNGHQIAFFSAICRKTSPQFGRGVKCRPDFELQGQSSLRQWNSEALLSHRTIALAIVPKKAWEIHKVDCAGSTQLPDHFSAPLNLLPDIHSPGIKNIEPYPIWHGHCTELMLNEAVSAKDGDSQSSQIQCRQKKLSVEGSSMLKNVTA